MIKRLFKALLIPLCILTFALTAYNDECKIDKNLAKCEHSDSDKMYIDEEEFSTEGDAFHIHVGNNVWLVTNTVHRDKTGLFTYECNLRQAKNGSNLEYQKTWKCPYCYRYWKIGEPCKNKDCPSKYK